MGTDMPRIELVYFTGCPNVDDARANLTEALSARGLPVEWDEWDQLEVDTPERVKQYSSPTVLVNDRDVTGAMAVGAMACCAGGAPKVDQILEALG